MSEGRRARPQPTPETQHFWDGTRAGELRLQRCNACGKVYFPPRPFCPACGSLSIEWVQASGRGTVYSYTINRRGGGDLPEYKEAPPYVLAYVQLEEGPRIMTNIVDCDVESVRIGQAVEVVFHDTGAGTALPRFRPAR